MASQKWFIYIILIVISVFAAMALAEEGKRKIRRIEFDEQQIEGKIRRPQLVLIKAEQRPTFAPMLMQSLAGNTSVVEFVAAETIEKSPYDQAFKFNGMKISNYVP